MHARDQASAGEPTLKSVFVGSFAHTLDPKKRLTIPSEWRAQVGTPKSLYILPDVQEKCLSVLPAAEMMRRLTERQHARLSDREARRFSRVVASQSALVTWDTQGRIRVPDALLNFAELKEQVELLGAFETFELWNPDALAAAGGLDRAGIEEAARHVGF